MKTKIVKLDKTPFENGKETGILFKKDIQDTIDKYVKLSQDKDIWEKCEISLKKLQEEYPVYYEETKGKAEGAEVDFKAFWVMMCPEVISETDHCTTIMTKKSNGQYIITHNEDDEYTDTNCFLSKVYTENGWFAILDIFSMPFGNAYCWNSHGIVRTINYCFEPKVHIGNISRYYGQRHISEAKSIDDLIKRCKEMKLASGFHVNAIDSNTNVAVSIEVYPDGEADVKYIDDYYFHTNHYIHKKYENNPQPGEESNSIFRINKTAEFFSKLENIDLPSIRNILKYRGETDDFYSSIFQTKKDPYLTGMNFAFDMDEKDKIYINNFTTNEDLKLDYELI